MMTVKTLKYTSIFCSLRGFLYTFLVLCIMIFGSILIYVYLANDTVDLSLNFLNNVNKFYLNDAKLLLKVQNSVNDDKVISSTSLHGKGERLPDNVFKKTTQITKQTKPSKQIHIKTTNLARKDMDFLGFEHNFNYVIDNESICKRKEGDPQIELIVFIFTTHNRKLQRDTIRRTWISYAKQNTAQNIRYAFLLGETNDTNLAKSIAEENKKHHDIIKEDFTDAYSNLTYKTMMAYKYASTKCKDVKYVMKTDDDVYANIPAVFNVIKTHGKLLQTAIGGSCNLSGQPDRYKESKWYASVSIYPHSHYPGFCSGTGYITSQNVAAKVFKISKHVPFFHLEDVYVAMCIKKLGYKLKRIEGFNPVMVTPDICTYKSGSMVTSHKVPLSMMEHIWQGKCKKNEIR